MWLNPDLSGLKNTTGTLSAFVGLLGLPGNTFIAGLPWGSLSKNGLVAHGGDTKYYQHANYQNYHTG